MQREADRDACHQQTMLKRSFVMAADVVEPGREPALRDASHDVMRCAFSVGQADRRSAENVGEDRGDGADAVRDVRSFSARSSRLALSDGPYFLYLRDDFLRL